jgi:hypothetical protein
MTTLRVFWAAASLTLLASPSFAQSKDGLNRHVTINNLSSQAIYYLYASPVTSDSWEEDLLGPDRVISAGESLDANIDNGTNACDYDLRVVMEDGEEHIQRDVNVCVVSAWSIGDSGNSIQ